VIACTAPASGGWSPECITASSFRPRSVASRLVPRVRDHRAMRRRTRAIGSVMGAVRGRRPWAPLPPDGLAIVAYHRIDDGGGGLAVSRGEFVAQLDWISEAGLPVVDVAAAGSFDGAGARIALTFDDGYRSVAEIAWPELRARGWPATLYAVSRVLDDPARFAWDAEADSASALLDRGSLKELADDGMRIGSHTRSHRYLPGLPPQKVAEEVEASRSELEDALGRLVTSFSYPMGGWTRSIRTLVERAGYETAVTMDRGTNVVAQDRLALRRHPAEPDLATFIQAISGWYDFLRPIDRWRSRRIGLATERGR
jgi:peptidoglycan/xylan/chitin deacetylase (PgdA/CDA1 family)